MDTDQQSTSPVNTTTAASKIRKFILTALFAAGWVLFTFDLCAPTAWSFLMVGTGLFLAVLLTNFNHRALLSFTTFTLCIVPTMIALRMLPVHSLDWSGIDRVEVERFGKDHFEVTDPADLRQFERFARRGSYGSMLKSGFGYNITVWKQGIGRGYYVHGNCFGHLPGGLMQSVFVPSDDGLMEWFEDMLQRHGHPRHRTPDSAPTNGD